MHNEGRTKGKTSRIYVGGRSAECVVWRLLNEGLNRETGPSKRGGGVRREGWLISVPSGLPSAHPHRFSLWVRYGGRAFSPKSNYLHK
jgi:hypothetical protein